MPQVATLQLAGNKGVIGGCTVVQPYVRAVSIAGVIGGRNGLAALLFGDNDLGINNDDLMRPCGEGER